MLKNNIYITYPAGYMGTYVNWIISISDKDLKKTTVPNPLTTSNNAHGHIKYPTHISWLKTLTWIAKNRPDKKLIYAINARKEKDYYYTPEFAIQNIARIDQNPVFINCHDDDHDDTMKFGALNMFTKWPTYIAATNVWYDDYDPSTDTDVIRSRNWLLENWKKFNPGNSPINPDIIMYNLDKHKKWYHVRKKTAPLEISESQYLIPDRLPNHILDISINQIISKDFIDLLKSMLMPINCGDFDFEDAKKFHTTYLDNQDNISWFKNVDKFRQRREVDSWFFKNAFTQALLLMEFDQDQLVNVLSLETQKIADRLLCS